MSKLIDSEIRRRKRLIIEDYEGIYPVYEAFYIHSILYSSERSETAFQRFDKAVTDNETAAQVFAAVQEALTHAAALSRFFWPVKKNDELAAARGNQLRKAFGLCTSSPLESRKLRNALEHFDEDLDRFLLEDRTGYFFPAPLIDEQGLADDALGNIFKLVDPEAGICVLLGIKFPFLPIRHEVQSILSLALQMEKDGHLFAISSPSK